MIAEANASGSATATYSYGPYGEPDVATGAMFRYTGQLLDAETGLYYYKARYYSPALGRFLQTDPIGYEADQNLYVYVGNDPVNVTDPSGECPWCVGGIIGFAFQTAREIKADSFKGGLTSKEGLKALGRIAVSTGVGAATAGLGGVVSSTVVGLGGRALVTTVASNAAKNSVISGAASGSGKIVNNVIAAGVDGGADAVAATITDGSFTDGAANAAIGGAMFGAGGSVAGDTFSAAFATSSLFGSPGTLSPTGAAMGVTLGNSVANLSSSDIPAVPPPTSTLCDSRPGAC